MHARILLKITVEKIAEAAGLTEDQVRYAIKTGELEPSDLASVALWLAGREMLRRALPSAGR